MGLTGDINFLPLITQGKVFQIILFDTVAIIKFNVWQKSNTFSCSNN